MNLRDEVIEVANYLRQDPGGWPIAGIKIIGYVEECDALQRELGAYKQALNDQWPDDAAAIHKRIAELMRCQQEQEEYTCFPGHAPILASINEIVKNFINKKALDNQGL